MKSNEPKNPFYVLLLLAGSAFAITAFAFGLVAASEVGPVSPDAYSQSPEVQQRQGFKQLLNRYGMTAIGIELGVLAVGTVGAIWLDSRRQRMADAEKRDEQQIAEKT